MTRIQAKGVCVDIPVPSVKARSVRNVAMAAARRIGGNIRDDGTHIAVVRALHDVSFELGEGDRLGLIGHNGAGKTTLIRVLAGVYTPTQGTLQLTGRLVPMFDIGLGFDPEATGLENIQIRGMMLGLSDKEIKSRTQEIAEFSELSDYLSLPIRTYSQGMLLRLMFAIATSIEGDIILMDEWISVGDEVFQRKAHDRMLAITERAGILVIASHSTTTLLEHCTLGLRLEKGAVVDFGPIQAVLETAGMI